MVNNEYSRVNRFLTQACAIWGHKISQEFKSHDNIKNLCSIWTDATRTLTDYQFKTAANICKQTAPFFPTIADFLKEVPKNTNNNIQLSIPEIDLIKNQLKNLAIKRNEILFRANEIMYNSLLSRKQKKNEFAANYTLTRAIDEQLVVLEIKLKNSGITIDSMA